VQIRLAKFVIGAFVVALFGCGGGAASESQTFEALLLLVEKGESVLEDGKVTFEPAQKDFLECLTQITYQPWGCETERQYLENAFDATLEKYEFQGLMAETNSLRLTGNEEASRARDSFVKHLRAWRDYISDFRYSMPSSAQISSEDYTFVVTWKDISDNNQISDTFDELCSGLGNAQPSKTSEFSGRIIDICDD
jgi:hypothetical protein